MEPSMKVFLFARALQDNVAEEEWKHTHKLVLAGKSDRFRRPLDARPLSE